MAIGPVKVKKYRLEFKLTAVQLSDQPGALIKDVAALLCIHPVMLSRWRKQVRDGVLIGDRRPPEPPQAAKLQRLRDVQKELKRLQLEQSLLESAIRFSSQREPKSLRSPRQAR